jgi:hypothetical protein
MSSARSSEGTDGDALVEAVLRQAQVSEWWWQCDSLSASNQSNE